MKETLLFGLIFCFSIVAFSQENEFVLKWENSKDIRFSVGKSIRIHGFQSENYIYDVDEQTLLFAANVKHVVSESTATIKSVAYENITSEQLKGYNLSLVKDEVDFIVKRTNARGIIGGYVEFNPIIKINGQYKKVVSIAFDFGQSNKASFFAPPPSITNSELANGLWYRFYVEKTGVYMLDKDFLTSLGVDVNGVNPKNIRLFGNGGKAIPLSNSDINEFDVTENAVKFIGEGDGVFNDQDYMLFYAVSSLGWDAENDSHISPYINKTYYYINVSTSVGKRIQSLVEPSASVDSVFNTFDEYQYYEVDKNNLVQLGRRWFGDSFDVNSSQSFAFDFPRIDMSQQVRLNVKVAATSTSLTNMTISLNGSSTPISTLSFGVILPTALASGRSYSDFISSSQNIVVDLRYDNGSNPSSNAYLDYVSVEATSYLRSLGQQFSFRNKQAATTSGVGEYVLNNASSVSEVWDVTDIYNVRSKLNSNASVFRFKTSLGSLREYVAIVNSDFYTPQKESSTVVNNINIKGTIFQGANGEHEDVDYIVVTPILLKAQATRLANINASNLGLRTRVITLEDIYSEFNTGNQDIGAVRNFVRYVYQNGVTDKLKYLCLFGDASFDMKDRILNNTNLVPTFHALQSFSLVSGYMSDDYFGMMDDDEGAMGTSDRLDIAVGRIVAGDLQQATEMVTKVEQYYQLESYGSWRNRMTILSDDVDEVYEHKLEYELDALADEIVGQRPFVNMVKLHSDAFTQESSAGGELYPQATESLLNNIQLGSLVVNYFGHGGEDGLAYERLFQKNDALNLNNIFRYNLFVTVTCEFTRFDNPLRQTGGEFTYWNPNGGAISLIATTREISVGLGIAVNRQLAKYLFDYNNTGYVSTAEALRLAKNDINNQLKRVVFNVGDPALKLAIPKPNIKLTHINDVAVSDPAVPVLEALGRVVLSGEVIDEGGQLISDYNGKLSTTIYDKKQNRVTLANDGTIGLNLYTGVFGVLKLNYETLGEIVFRGQASITNGKFRFEFVVPRDISIPVGNGKVSFYAKRNGQLENQTGVDAGVKIGGINENAPADNLPPTIEAFMDDESFVSGGVTGQSPFLLLKLGDENGINTASGIGHDITAIMDGDEANPLVLNDYYETEIDDFTKGNVKYQYKDLEPGLHTLTLKAWDVYNNSMTTEIEFVVVNEYDELVINRVLNYPNPFVSYTEFWFKHNSSSELEVMVQIYTVSGKLVKTLRGNSSSGNKGGNTSLFRGLPWDGKDDFGDRIGKGVYVYKLTVKSVSTNKKVVKYEKLVIL
ncbi:MAG: type IX secretion system sortase PorU [Flavobacteriaceae bacterium]|nr:type IX secretion system sortase PorU [Flavobacteriaceae bacterium]